MRCSLSSSYSSELSAWTRFKVSRSDNYFWRMVRLRRAKRRVPAARRVAMRVRKPVKKLLSDRTGHHTLGGGENRSERGGGSGGRGAERGTRGGTGGKREGRRTMRNVSFSDLALRVSDRDTQRGGGVIPE